MELIKAAVEKKVKFGKDSFRTFTDHNQHIVEQEQTTVPEENDKKIVKRFPPQAVMVDKTLYISGQLGMGKDGSIVGGGTLAQVCWSWSWFWHKINIEPQAKQSLKNIGEILEAAGGGYKDVIKTTVLMKDISEFSAVNNIYSDFFSHHQPARAAFQVAALPKGGDIEIEAVAIIGELKSSLNDQIKSKLQN